MPRNRQRRPPQHIVPRPSSTFVVDFSDVVERFQKHNGIFATSFVSNLAVNYLTVTFATKFTFLEDGSCRARVLPIVVDPCIRTEGFQLTDASVLDVTIDKKSDFRLVHEYIKDKIIVPYRAFDEEYEKYIQQLHRRHADRAVP